MRELDLGSKQALRVKVEGEAYEVHAPTVSQTEKFQKDMKKDDEGSMTAFMALLSDLGLPKDVTKKLDVVQVQKLSEGLLGLVEKK